MYNSRVSKRDIILIGIVVLILLGGIGYFYLQNSASTRQQIPASLTPTTQQPSPSISQTSGRATLSPSNEAVYCRSQNLQASLNLSPGAGNVYGTFMVKNISQGTCQVQGGEFILAKYDTNTVKNITVTHVGQTQKPPFILSPGETIYSQVHYPNGPQCQSIGLNTTGITFSYQISLTNTIAFKNQEGNTEEIPVHTCKSPTDMTEIQIWNMATQPITPLTP